MMRRMRTRMKDALTSLLSLLVPPRATERMVERLSLEDLRALVLPDIRDGLLPYHDPRVKALVWELKYYRNRRALSLAGILLAEHVADIAAEEMRDILLVPIPMHRTSRLARGFDHAHELCKEIARRIERCSVAPLLRKTRETPRQATLPAEARRMNLSGAFAAHAPEHPLYAHVVVIDDVTTTGATFRESEHALRSAGIVHIRSLALARS